MRCRLLGILINIAEQAPEQLMLDFPYHIDARTSQNPEQRANISHSYRRYMLRSSKNSRFHFTRRPSTCSHCALDLDIVAEPRRPAARSPLEILKPRFPFECYMQPLSHPAEKLFYTCPLCARLPLSTG